MNVLLPFTHNKIFSTLGGFETQKALAKSNVNKMIGTVSFAWLNCITCLRPFAL